MATDIQYALMAGASYISTRSDVNKFPVPDGWVESIEDRQKKPSGFEATYFQNGTDIVISYAGTNGDGGGISTNPDKQASIVLALGTGSAQLVQAAEYYLNGSKGPGSNYFDDRAATGSQTAATAQQAEQGELEI